MADEEERLMRMMNKKSEEAFEKKRREALEKYAQKTGKTDFHLAEKEKPAKVAPAAQHSVAGTTTAPIPASSIPQHNANWKEEHERREREERERELEEQKRRDAALKEMSKDASDDLSKWKEEQERKEKEFRQRLAEEERRKNEEIERMRKEALLKKQKEEEEYRKQQAAKQAAQPAQQQPQSTNWCENCKREFSGILDVFIVNGKKYCKACQVVAHTSDPKAPKCAHCKLPLEMTWLNAAGRKYHPECLRCSTCGGDLSKGFRQAGRTFTCTECSGFGLRR